MTGIRTLGVALAVGLAALSLSMPTVSDAAGGPGPEEDTLLSVVAQTAWVQPDGEFRLALRVDGSPPGAVVTAALHSRLDDLPAFEESVAGGDLGQVFNPGPELALDTASPAVGREGWQIAERDDPSIDVEITLALRSETSGDTEQTYIPASDDGVYPFVVEIRDADGETIAELVTYLVRLPDDAAAFDPLDVSLVVPIHAPVALAPDGTTTFDDGRLGELEEVLAPIERHGGAPVVLAPTAETVVGLAAGGPEASTVGELVTAVSQNRQVLSGTYVDLPLAAWTSAGLDESLVDQTTSSAESLADVLGVRPDSRTWIAQPTITTEGLTELRSLGVDQAVIPEEILVPLETDPTSPIFDVINSSGTRQRAAVADQGLAAYAAPTRDPVLAGHRFLADLSVRAFDAGGAEAGAVAVLPDDVPVPAAFLDTVLSGFGDPSVVRGVSLDALFGETDPGDEATVRELLPQPSPDLGAYPEELLLAQRKVAGLRSMIGPDAPMPDLIDELELVSGASSLAPEEQSAYLDAASARVDEAVGQVRVQQTTVTLTDREGVIPISIVNDLGVPVTVRIQVDSEKLELPEGSVREEVVPPGGAPFEIPVTTRASGAFPVDIRVSSPDGVIALSDERITVRSTAVSGLGVVLSALAALFLAVWWLRHFRRGRRARRLVRPDDLGAVAEVRRTQERFIDEI